MPVPHGLGLDNLHGPKAAPKSGYRKSLGESNQQQLAGNRQDHLTGLMVKMASQMEAQGKALAQQLQRQTEKLAEAATAENTVGYRLLLFTSFACVLYGTSSEFGSVYLFTCLENSGRCRSCSVPGVCKFRKHLRLGGTTQRNAGSPLSLVFSLCSLLLICSCTKVPTLVMCQAQQVLRDESLTTQLSEMKVALSLVLSLCSVLLIYSYL